MTREEEIWNAIFNLRLGDYNDNLLKNDEYSGNDLQDAFYKGAKWADEHPNFENVWHDVSEEPQCEYYVISQKKDGAIDFIDYTGVEEYYYSWKHYIKEENIVSWAYISDLLPKTK